MLCCRWGMRPQAPSSLKQRPELAGLSGTRDTMPDSEDCLTLNVWTRGIGHGAKRPVMVWYHGGAFSVAGADMVVLRSDVPLRPDGFKHFAEFSVTAGETVTFVLGYARSFEDPPGPVSPTKALDKTAQAWLGWANPGRGTRRYSAAVLRSLITLKALTYRPTGGIVAAPTTSLPERFGWRKIRDQIHDEVCRRGYNVKLGAFVQSFGSTQLDASALLIPLVGFLTASDERVRSTSAVTSHARWPRASLLDTANARWP